MGRAKRKVFRPIFGRDLTSSTGRRTQERIDNTFHAAQQLYDINAEKYRDTAIRNLRDSGGFEGLNEAEKQIAIDKEIANIMPKWENPFADISSNPETEGAIQQDEKRAKAKGDNYSLLDKAEVWMNASMNKLLANTMQSVKAGSDVIRGAHDYFFSGNDVSPNRMLSEAVEQEGKGAFYNIFGVGNKYLAETAEVVDRTIQSAEASLASRGMDSGFWHAASDMVGQWGFTYGGMGTAALGRLGGGLFSGLGKFSKSVTAAARWAKASEYTRKAFSAVSLFYGALSEAAIESYGVSKTLEEAKEGQLTQLRDMMQKDFDQDPYSYERKYGAIKFSDFSDDVLAASNMDPRLKREVSNLLSGKSQNASPSAVAAADTIVSQYKHHAEEAILKNASDEIDQRNGLASGWSAGLNTFILTFFNKYTYELATDKLAGANRLKKAGRLGALGSTLINATTEGIEEVVQGGISKGAESIGKRSVDEMLRASTISERNSTSIGVLGSLGEIAKGMWNTATSASPWVDEALPAIVSTLLMPMYKGSKIGSESHRTDAFGDARHEKKSWLSRLYDEIPIGISGIERYRNYKYSGGKQRTADEAIEAMTKMVKGRHDDLTKEEKRVMTEIFGQNYAEVVHETYQSVVDAMSSADRMNALLAQISQTSSDSADTAVAEELAKAHNVATMISVIGNSSIGQANFNKRNFSQWSSDLMRSTREFGADMGHAISSLFGANTEEKEARYQAALAKRKADREAIEEARKSESDPFADVPDNLRPFLNFLDVKETDEATLVSIARQRIENTLDPEEKQKMQEAYFQGEGSDKLTEKAIKDIAGEINKQKHTLADIATDYSRVRTFFDLTTKAGEFSGREKSRIAAAAASFNHLRRLSSEYMDAFEEELSGIYNEIFGAAKNRMTELLKDREAMRDNLNIDDEERKSRLKENIDAINKEIEALEKHMRAIEEAQKKKENAPKADFSNVLGGWDEFMKRFDAFDELNNTYGEAAVASDNDELAKKLAELTLVNESRLQSGALAIKFANEAMAGIEALNKMIEDKNARERLAAEAANKEKKQAKQDAADAVINGEPKENVDKALDSAESNGLESDTANAAKAAAAKAAEGEGSELSRHRSSVRNAIKDILMNNEDFIGILRSFELDSDAIDKFIDDLISMVNDVVAADPDGGYTDYREALTDALNLLTDLKNNPDLANQIFGLNNDDLIAAVAKWIKGNIDKFPDDPTTPVSTLNGEPSRADAGRRVDSIEFDQAMQRDIESASVGGVTILNARTSERLQDLLSKKNALASLLRKAGADINTSIIFADGKATINISIDTKHGTYEFSFSLGYDDLRNRLQMGVSLSTLVGDIVDTIINVNDRKVREAFDKASKDYIKKNRDAQKNSEGKPNSGEQNNKGRGSDTKPVVHEGPVPGSTPPASIATDSTTDDGNKSPLPQTGPLELWDEFNPGLKEAKLTALSTEWQERIRKWYEEKSIGLNLKNAKGEEIFYGFAEELSENGNVSNSPLVVYVKDEQGQFVSIGLLPVSTSGNTQVLINNARAVATEDKKFNIFSSSDLNAPKVTISKVKYSPFEAERVRGNKTIDAETIENGVEEELKRGQVAISVTAFTNGDNSPTIKSTTHDKNIDSKTAEVIDAFIKEKESFLAQNYGQTYLVVLVNGKDGPKPILVGVKGRDLIIDLVQGTAGDSKVSELANEYMAKLTEEFEKAMETPDGEASGVYGEKYSNVFGSSFVYSVKPLRDADGNVTQVEITFPKRLNEGNIQSSAPVIVDIDISSGNTRQALANAIVDAMKSSGKEKRRTGIAESIMGNKEKVEDVMTNGMRMTEVRDEAGFEALSEEKDNEEGNKTTPELDSPPQGSEGTTTEVEDPSLKRRGHKQIERAKARLANAKDENDTIDAIAEFERNVSRGAEATDEEIRLFDEAKLELKEKGYELISPVGQTYKEGMNVIVENIELDETLPPGKEIISYVVSPQVNKDGKMIRAAKVHLKISPYEEGEEATTIPTPAPMVSTVTAGKTGDGDGPFGSANQDSLEKIKDNLAKELVDEGYSVVVKSSTSPNIAAARNGIIYMFEIDPVSGSHKKVEWSQMHSTLKADAFALINSALSSDFKSSKNGKLLEYGEEMSGTTHTIVVRRSTKGISTGNKEQSSGSNADRIVRLAGEEKHVAAHAIKTEPTLRGLVLELAAKGVSSGTPIYFSEHTINGKTYGGGHKVILQAKDEHGNIHSVEVEIDNELGAKMDKIAEDVRELSVKKVSEGFTMISDVKMKDPNKGIITGEADIVFFRNDGEKGESIVADIKSTLIASENSSPADEIRSSQHDGVYATTKYKAQVDGYETHIKSLGFKKAEQGYIIAVGYATSNGATVVEAMSLDENNLNRHRKTLDRGTKTGSNGLKTNDQDEANSYEEREAFLPFERGDVYKEAHDVAKLLPQGMLYQAIRIHKGIAEVTPGVWGRYRNGIIEVASGASAGTLYHEAMHFIYEKLLTDADRGMLVSGLSEVTEEQIKEIFGNQIPIAYARDVRELSAELFRLWMQTKGDKKARKALEEKITKLAPKKKGFWGRLQALWERIKAAMGYTPTSSVVSILTGIEGGNYSHVSVASRVNATNLSSPMEGVVESMLRYGLMSEEEFNSSYDPSSIMASRNLAQLIHRKLMELAYEALSDLEGDKIVTDHAGNIRRREGDLDDAIAVLRDAASTSEKAKHAVEIIDELGIDSETKTIQEMGAIEERTDNLLGQTLAGCR